MNDPNKRIDVNLSSLLSLKAELLRKKEEASRSTRHNTDAFVPKKSSKADKKPKVDKVASANDDVKVYEHEDYAMLEKSQRVLEAKSKFYDKMTALGGSLNSDDNCLVMFNQKKQDVKEDTVHAVRSDSSSDGNDSSDDEEEWVEFEDCLGRTRKCLKRDLVELKRKDNELSQNMPERLDMSAPNWMIDTKGSHPRPEESVLGDASMVSKHDEMRMNWEKKEEENITKGNIHYQDVFFDEARQHGVGYYAFSTDDEERAKQQKALEEMRKKTLAEQAEKDAQREVREKIIAERVRAAKNRQRARVGLPPLADEPEERQEEAERKPETKEERKLKKKEEKKKLRQEREEKQKEEDRKNYIRPWDKNKTGVAADSSDDDSDKEWAYKPDRQPMSQEQWNERKRTERVAEFAPVPEKSARTSFEQRNPFSQPAPPVFREPPNFASFQSSKPRGFQRRNYMPNEEETGHPSRGACIPPPESLEFSTNRPPVNANLEMSIEAGLKFLRNNSDKGTLTTKSKWSANADY